MVTLHLTVLMTYYPYPFHLQFKMYLHLKYITNLLNNVFLHYLH